MSLLVVEVSVAGWAHQARQDDAVMLDAASVEALEALDVLVVDDLTRRQVNVHRSTVPSILSLLLGIRRRSHSGAP
jgi:hypothetical protein